MAVSRNSRTSGNDPFSDSFFGQISRYDLLLAAIPLVLALGFAAGRVLPVALHVSVGAGALCGCLLLADALYVNPPTDPAGGS